MSKLKTGPKGPRLSADEKKSKLTVSLRPWHRAFIEAKYKTVSAFIEAKANEEFVKSTTAVEGE